MPVLRIMFAVFNFIRGLNSFFHFINRYASSACSRLKLDGIAAQFPIDFYHHNNLSCLTLKHFRHIQAEAGEQVAAGEGIRVGVGGGCAVRQRNDNLTIIRVDLPDLLNTEL